MRTIKFRAQNFGGHWIYSEKVGLAVFFEYLECDHPVTNKRTLGEYTGLHDKNGVEVFEGDIVRWGNSSQYSCGVVIYEGYNFCVSNILHSTNDDRMYFNHSDSFEVIGNIYENPELMKEGAE